MTHAIHILMFSIVTLLLTSCVSTNENSEASSPISFIFPHRYDEYTVVKVKLGADRGDVEGGLVRDQVGRDRLAQLYEKHFTFRRIRSAKAFEQVLNKYFGGGDEMARKMWANYPNATFSALECDNYTIIFFDSADKAVMAYPIK